MSNFGGAGNFRRHSPKENTVSGNSMKLYRTTQVLMVGYVLACEGGYRADKLFIRKADRGLETDENGTAKRRNVRRSPQLVVRYVTAIGGDFVADAFARGAR